MAGIIIHLCFMEINENAYQGLEINDWILASTKHRTERCSRIALFGCVPWLLQPTCVCMYVPGCHGNVLVAMETFLSIQTEKKKTCLIYHIHPIYGSALNKP